MAQGVAYVMLFRFINEILNFCINNIVRKPIINKGLFNTFEFFKKDISRERDEFSSGNKCFYGDSFYNGRGIHYWNWGRKD